MIGPLPSTISTDYGSGAAAPVAPGNSAPAAPAGSADPTPPQADTHIAAPAAQFSEAELQQAVANLQRKAQTAAPTLQFSIDREANRFVIKVTDSATREVIRQFPPEEILHLAKELDRMQGLLLNKRA